jgi:hypothetical protein
MFVPSFSSALCPYYCRRRAKTEVIEKTGIHPPVLFAGMQMIPCPMAVLQMSGVCDPSIEPSGRLEIEEFCCPSAVRAHDPSPREKVMIDETFGV